MILGHEMIILVLGSLGMESITWTVFFHDCRLGSHDGSYFSACAFTTAFQLHIVLYWAVDCSVREASAYMSSGKFKLTNEILKSPVHFCTHCTSITYG